jgi:hypothetical protein
VKTFQQLQQLIPDSVQFLSEARLNSVVQEVNLHLLGLNTDNNLSQPGCVMLYVAI